ncbi:MAG: hypothetical protein ACQKBT_01350, partial [Puniceicoccales bacterium]
MTKSKHSIFRGVVVFVVVALIGALLFFLQEGTSWNVASSIPGVAVMKNGEGNNIVEGEDVVFWAHYMPQIPTGHLHAHPHVGGNQDTWPLNTQYSDQVVAFKEEINQALSSGIDGFQMLVFVPEEILQAAKEVLDETGNLFYIAPEWCAMPKDEDEAIARIVDFARKYENHPNIYRRDGRQVHFMYGYQGPWQETNEGIERFKRKLSEAGVSIILVPTLHRFDRYALGREDLAKDRKPWPDPEELIFGDSSWLQETAWDGATAFSASVREDIGLELVHRLENEGKGFYWIPSLVSGYDSSNRPGQAIHTRFDGMRTLWNNLKFWIENGFRQITYVTWNDCLETMLIPSSRNVWGYNTIVKYWNGIAESGENPFSEDQIVVSYPADVLLGDEYYFQVLAIPAEDEDLQIRAVVELKPNDADHPMVYEIRAEGSDGRPILSELRVDTSRWKDVRAVQPKVTIEKKVSTSPVWEPLFENTTLGMSLVHYNKVRFPVPNVINLAYVDLGAELKLELADNGPLELAKVSYSSKTPVRRMALMEGPQSLGMFRSEDLVDVAEENEFDYQGIYLRLEASKSVPVTLTLEGGVIHDLYSPYWDLAKAVVPVNRTEAT